MKESSILLSLWSTIIYTYIFDISEGPSLLDSFALVSSPRPPLHPCLACPRFDGCGDGGFGVYNSTSSIMDGNYKDVGAF